MLLIVTLGKAAAICCGLAAWEADLPHANIRPALPIAITVMRVAAMIVIVAVVAVTVIVIAGMVAIIVMGAVVIISRAPIMPAVDASDAPGR